VGPTGLTGAVVGAGVPELGKAPVSNRAKDVEDIGVPQPMMMTKKGAARNVIAGKMEGSLFIFFCNFLL
jgi:hypothetical protein